MPLPINIPSDPSQIQYPIPYPYGTQENTTGIPGAMSVSYWVRRHRKFVSGTHLVPVAGSPTVSVTGTVTPVAAQFVTLHAPYGLETVYWASVKEGQPPTVPAPDLLADTNHVFLWGEQCADAPMILPGGGGHTWLMAGIYYYGFILPVSLDADFPTASMPFDPMPVDQGTYPAENFSTAILSGGEPLRSAAQLFQNIKGPGG